MSFSSAYANVSNAIANTKMTNIAQQAEDRAEKQQRLTALSMGFQQNQGGNYVPDINKQLHQDIEKQKLEATLKATQAQQEAIQAKFNADSIAKITESFMSGNIDDALKAWRNTPGLKEAIAKAPSLDAQDIDAINFNSPDDIQQLKDMEVDETHLQDPEVQDALKRSFMRVQGHDGKWRLVPVDQVTKQTNSKAFMTKEQADRYAEGARKVLATIQGLNPKTEDIKDKQLDLLDNKLSVTQQALDSKDPKKVMAALALTNPELFLKSIQKGSTRRDSLEQYTTAFLRAHPEATEKEFQEAMAKFVNARAEGVGSNRENTDVSTIKTKAAPKEPKQKEAFNKETEILTSLKQTDKTKYDLVNRDLKILDTNYQLATNIQKVIEGPAKKIDTDMVQSVKDKLNKWAGIDDKQTISNANFQTKGGALLATYILSRSGTAASDKERDFLQNLMMSSNLDDETYVRNALKAFKESLVEQNDTLSDSISEYAPYSAKKYRMAKDNKETEEVPEPGTIEDGYKFLGGDPAKPENWEKVK